LERRTAKHKSVFSPALKKKRKYLQSITVTFPWKICKHLIMERYMRFILKKFPLTNLRVPYSPENMVNCSIYKIINNSANRLNDNGCKIHAK
jgi:hypothetical protein